jgi:DNA helicase-2/ATP-dependent DNA helicase PcrA
MKEAKGANILRLQNFESMQEELKWVAKDINDRSKADWVNCVILARTKKLLESAAQILTEAGLTPALVVRKNEFESAPLRWLHATLRLANARGDKEQVRRICKSFYELGGVDIRMQDVIAFAALTGGDYLRSWYQKAMENPGLERATQEFLKTSQAYIVERLEFVRFCRLAFSWFDGLEKNLSPTDDEGFTDYHEERIAWEELQSQTFSKYGQDDVTLNILLQEFDLAPKSPPTPPHAIKCLTIHSAKGLEFGHVYLVGLVEDQLPSFGAIKKGDQSREMQEERRNCFVAITRTQLSLTMTYAGEYFGWHKSPSRFLEEMELLEPDSESELEVDDTE